MTATDPDDTIVDLAVTAVTPAPAAGAISRTGFTPADAVGGTATATITASAQLPAGTYAVTVTATDAEGATATCTLPVKVAGVLTVGQVQGPTADDESGVADRSPLAPPSGNGSSSEYHDVRGVITQKTLARTSAGAAQHGFFLQSRIGDTDGDPASSDGIFVFMGGFTSLIGGYTPTVGDEVVLRARVSEYYNMTQLSGASLVRKLASGLDVDTVVEVADAVPPAELADAERFWERHEGARLRVRAGSGAVSGRAVFASTADSEMWLVDRDDPLLDRTDPYARRVFRDTHPLDNDPSRGFDDGNGQRIMLGSMGVKATAGDSATLLPPVRTFDTLTTDAVGGLYYSFEKFGIQVESAEFTAGADPSANHPPQPANRSAGDRDRHVQRGEPLRLPRRPLRRLRLHRQLRLHRGEPALRLRAGERGRLQRPAGNLADQIVTDLHAPDLILVQEAEDQDICTVVDGAMSCGTTNNADGAPDTLQELALAITAAGGPAYAAAYDRTGADARGITSAFMYRTDRISLAEAAATDAVLGCAPAVQYRSAGLPANTDVQNPKSLNALLPADVDRSTGIDGPTSTPARRRSGKFTVAAAPGAREHYTLWAVSNHFSSGPDSRVGQRREQAAYGAAIVDAIEAADRHARVVYGGDLNVFPRPDDPIATGANPTPSDQLGPLYDAGLHNLWDDLLADAPSAAYSYSFEGHAQTLDHLFVNAALHGDLIEMRAAHINADWPADHAADGSRGSSDHDPQVARFRSRASLSVADASVVEGDKGTTPLTFTATVSRPLSQPVLICAAAVGGTAQAGAGLRPVRRLPHARRRRDVGGVHGAGAR